MAGPRLKLVVGTHQALSKMDSRDAQHLDGCFLTDEVQLVVFITEYIAVLNSPALVVFQPFMLCEVVYIWRRSC